MANIHVCFTNSSIPNNASVHNFQDYYCVRCSTTFGSRCISPLGDESIIYRHEFNITNSYFSNVKNCSSVYTISFHKHHISSKDSGTVTFRVDVGTAVVNKTVSLCVKPGHWKTMYLIGCSTAFALGLLVSVVVYVCYCSRNKMKKPMYQRLPSSLPPSVVSTVSRSMSDVSNGKYINEHFWSFRFDCLIYYKVTTSVWHLNRMQFICVLLILYLCKMKRSMFLISHVINESVKPRTIGLK